MPATSAHQRASWFAPTLRIRRAFTLVELLVVIGIITVLMSILLPVIGKARRQAERIACASNLRQLAQALLMYAGENRQYLPLPAEDRYRGQEDWIHWQADREIAESSLWSYLGKGDKVLKCPSGVVEKPGLPYPYSYSINMRISGWKSKNPPPYDWHIRPVRLTKVKHSVRKILAMEENSDAIDDGGWGKDIHLVSRAPNPLNLSDWVSVRHDRGPESEMSGNSGTWTRRGNVVFVDGHCAFMLRSHAGSPYHADPTAEGAWNPYLGVPEH